MTATERKQRSRENNPERVAAYNAQRRARRHASRELSLADKLARSEQAQALPGIRTPLALPAPPVRLALPAPVQEPLFILPVRQRELVPVQAQAQAA